MISRPIKGALVGILILTGTGTPAVSADADAVVNAAAYQPIPSDDAILVRPFNDSTTNVLIKQDFEDALRARGYRVSDGESPLVLSFETRHDAAASPAPRLQTTTQIRERAHRQSVQSSRNLPKIIENPRDRTHVVAPTRYRLDAIVSDRASGTRLWHGWVTTDLGDRNTEALGRAMVAPLVNSIGDMVRQETVALEMN